MDNKKEWVEFELQFTIREERLKALLSYCKEHNLSVRNQSYSTGYSGYAAGILCNKKELADLKRSFPDILKQKGKKK
jgi:hypothetical protein